MYDQLAAILGDVRDYNGGMILKQNEHLNLLRTALGKTAVSHSVLLEKYFHAISPIEMRTSTEIEPLKQLFLLLLTATKTESRLPFLGSDFLFKQEPRRVYAILPMIDADRKKAIFKKLEELQIPSHQLAHFSLDVHDSPCSGFLLLSPEKELQEKFLVVLNLSH